MSPRINGQRGSTMVEKLGEHPHATADQAGAKALEIHALRARGEAIPRGFAVVPEAATDAAVALSFKAAREAIRL